MMKCLFAMTLALSLTRAPLPEKQDAVQAARRFLPPNSQLAELYTFDFRAGRVSSRSPAVLTGHIISDESNDIVFAYYSPRIDSLEKTLFLALLHPTTSGFEKVYEVAFRSQVLLAPQAIQILHLEGQLRDAVAVIHGGGAALGGEINVLCWEDPSGWRNIFPANGSVHYFTITPGQGRVRVRLGYGKSIDSENPISAFVAHYLAKDGPTAFMPLILLVLLVVSYVTRPSSRMAS
jgi:hypothetical protein